MASDIEQRNFVDKDGLEQFWDDIQTYMTRMYKGLPAGMQFSRIYQQNGQLHILVEPFGGDTEDRKAASRANLGVYSKAEIDANYKTKQDGVSEQFTEYQTLLDISQDTNGEISVRKQVIPTATVGTLGLTTLKGVVSADDGDNSNAATPKAVADAITAAIEGLDVAEMEIGQAKTVGVIKEVDGKIVVTAVPILVDTANIADNAVTGAKIADNAVTSAKIADGTIQSGDIGAGQIKTTNIEDAAVTGTKIASETITSANIQNGTIQSADIGIGQVHTTNIANSAVTTEKIANGAVTGAKIASETITSDNIQNGTIQSEDIGAGEIHETNIATNAVTTNKIANDAVTNDKVADNAIDTDQLINGAVTNDKIGHDAVDGDKIADGAVDHEHIAANAVHDTQILDGSVTRDKIANDAVNGDKIADDSIGNEHIADDAVHSEQIQDGSVTNFKIADGAVDYTKVTDTEGHPFAINISGNAATATDVQPGGELAQRIINIENVKADKVSNAVSGNFAGLDEHGNLTDSGHKHSDYKTKQTAVVDPTVPQSGTTTSLSFIDTISQDENGVITPTKKTLPKSDAINLDSSDTLATSAAVKAAVDASHSEVTGLNCDDQLSLNGHFNKKYITRLSQLNGQMSYDSDSMAEGPTENSAAPVTGHALFTEHLQRSQFDEWVRSLIPGVTTPSNQLADKAYVDAIGERLEARYLSTYDAEHEQYIPFPTHAAFKAAADRLIPDQFYYNGVAVSEIGDRKLDNNDVIVITSDETHLNEIHEPSTTRYRYQCDVATGDNGHWYFEYVINNTALNAAQLLAINSGITAEYKASYDNHLASQGQDPNHTNPHHVTFDQLLGRNGVDSTELGVLDGVDTDHIGSAQINTLKDIGGITNDTSTIQYMLDDKMYRITPAVPDDPTYTASNKIAIINDHDVVHGKYGVKDSGAKITSYYHSNDDINPVTGSAVKKAIDELDNIATSSHQDEKVIVTVTEENGIVTGVSVDDSNAASAAQGAKADTAIQTVSVLDNGDQSAHILEPDVNNGVTVDLSDYKRKQDPVDNPMAQGTSLTFIDTISQDDEGVITPTRKSVTVDDDYIVDGTNPASGTAITNALHTLEATVDSTGGTNVGVQVVETNGIITGVTVSDSSINANDLNDAITALDATVDSTGGKNVSVQVVEADGVITGVTVSDNTVNPTDLANAIDALDYTDTPIDSQFVTGVNEVNGVITVERSTIGTSDIVGFNDALSVKADKVGNATAGNLATLDNTGNLVDSGKHVTSAYRDTTQEEGHEKDEYLANPVTGTAVDAAIAESASSDRQYVDDKIDALDSTVATETAGVPAEGKNFGISVSEENGVLTGVSIIRDDTVNAADVSNAINALDATVATETAGEPASNKNFGISVTETDGVLTGVSIIRDNTINATDLTNAIESLDATVATETADEPDSDKNFGISIAEENGVLTGVTIIRDDTVNATDVSDAISSVINDLDAEVPSSGGTNVQFKVTEVDGKITEVNVTTDNTVNATDVDTKVATEIGKLDVDNITGFGADKTLKTLTETDGKIDATFQSILVDTANIKPDAVKTAQIADNAVDTAQINDGAVTYDKVTNDPENPFSIDISGNASTATHADDASHADVADLAKDVQEGSALDRRIDAIEETISDLDNTKADKVANAVSGNFAGLNADGNLTDSGVNANNFKTKQTAVTKTGAVLKTLTSLTQNANGEIDATFSAIQSATTTQKGVVQLAGSIGATVASENNKAASEKAVRDAIDGVVDGLDAEVTSSDGTNVQVKVTEVDGKITAVNVTTDETEDKNNKVTSWSATTTDAHYPSEKLVKDSLDEKADKVDNATDGNFAGLDANGNLTDSGHKHSDYKTKQEAVTDPTASGSTLVAIDSISQDTNGVVTATKKNIQSATTAQKGVVQLAGSIGATVASENNKAASEKAVRDAINALDVSDITANLGVGKTITALSESDGKISATASDIQIAESQVTGLETDLAGIDDALDTKEDKANKVTSWSATTTDTRYPSEKLVKDSLDTKVDKTTKVNGHALSGDVTVTKSDVGLENVVNTGDSDTPVENGTTKFTTGGAYTELNKKADKTATVSNVAYDGTNKKITKTINGTTSDVVTAATLKADMALDKVKNQTITVTSTSVSDGINTFNKYVHPTTTAVTAAAVKVGKDVLGHVELGEAITKADVGLDKVKNQAITVTPTSVSDGTNTFNKYVHPTTTAVTAAAVKVGKDDLGHVIIGDTLTKSDVELGNVDNTSDADKPVSTAQQAALDTKVDKTAGVTAVSWNSTAKKITKTINGTTSDVVSASTLKSAMGLAKSDVGLDNVTNDAQVKRSEMGVANGVATLDADGKVPSSQLPSYIDDVIEGYYYEGAFYEDSAHTVEIPPESGKVYVDKTSNLTYRWGGTAYVKIASDLALGETHATAYYGDLGKAAYDHSQLTSGNPHHVTKTDVGLGNVVNTGDSATPVSGGTTKFTTGGAYTELNKKADKTATVSNVAWDATNKKLTKTINGTTSDVVTASTIKTALGLTKSDVGLDNVDNTSDDTKKANFTGAVASGNTGFPTGGDVYTAIADGKECVVVTFGTPYSEVAAIVNAGKFPVLKYIDMYFPLTRIVGGGNTTVYWFYSTRLGDPENYHTSVTIMKYVCKNADPAWSSTSNTYLQNNSELVSSWSTTVSNSRYPSEKLVKTSLDKKVDKVDGMGLSSNDYTTEEKTKLAGIADGAEVNQNAFSNVKVGSTTVAADSKTDTLELVAGSNVTITPDATNDKITIAAKDTTYESKAAVSGGTDVSLVTTGEKYTWNSKQDALAAQTAYASKGSATKVPQITTNSLGQVTGITEVLISGVTPASHTHGNITNAGALQTNDVTIASGDKLVITDSSDSNKVARASAAFDGTTTTKALTQKGTFEDFAKQADIDEAIEEIPTISLVGDNHITVTSDDTTGTVTVATDLNSYTAYTAKGSATKVPQITTNSLGQVTGITEVEITGVTPAAHTHGSITNSGAIGTTSGQAVYTTTDGVLTAGSLATSDPTASGNSLSFIATVSQDAKGKITATKKSVTVDSTYSSTGTNPVNGKAIAAAIGTLNVEAITGTAGKTITSISESNGKISATYSAISITKSQISDFAHTHGNITNAGGITADAVTVASGDAIVVVDSSDTSKKVVKSSISFDGSTTTQALTKAGTWATFNNYSHPAGSAPSVTGFPAAGGTLSFGGTFDVNQVSTDSTSHVSSITKRTFTLPSLGTTETTAAKGNHTHTASIAADTGTSALAMTANTTYKLTAGGSTFIFTTPKDTTYTSKTAASGGTEVSLVTTGEKWTWNHKQDALTEMTTTEVSALVAAFAS